VVRSSNTRSLSRPARRRDARRGAILRAASQIFRDRGFADTGMRDIAEAADLSPANLYHYFRGKDEILYYCQDRALDQMLAAVAAAKRGSRRPADRLVSILTAHVRTLLDDVEGATAHLEVGSLAPALRTRLIHKRDRYEHAVRRLVADGIASGDFARLDPAVVTRAMLGALNWTVTWFRPGGAATASDVAATIAGYLVRGITNGRH